MKPKFLTTPNEYLFQELSRCLEHSVDFIMSGSVRFKNSKKTKGRKKNIKA